MPNQVIENVNQGEYWVITKKKKVTIKFVPPGGSSQYEWRKKRVPKGKWTKWHAIDPEPNKKGYVVFTVPMKKPGCYKVQLRGVNKAGKSKKRTAQICKEIPVLPGKG
jgi:hypothetical protein